MEDSPKSTTQSSVAQTTELTIFRSRYDNATDKRMVFSSFGELGATFEALSNRPTYKPEKGQYGGAELISPAIYTEGTTRANANVEYWGRWAALDIDNIGEISLADIRRRFEPYRSILYSTGSSTPAKPKFRAVFELTERVLADDIPAFWHALQLEVQGVGDEQTKDLARMFYVPGQYPGAFNFYVNTRGDPINPGKLVLKHPSLKAKLSGGKSLLDRLPKELQARVIENRANRLARPDMVWTSYRDCPFVNDRMVAEYKTISGEGWYRKMYALMVSLAANAVRQGYAITEDEIATVCRSLDQETGNWYKKRNFKGEAARALEFVYRNVTP